MVVEDRFSHEYDPESIKAYDVAGFRFHLTPRFAEHYVHSARPYEWLTIKVFNACIRPGSVAVDVGAHYGYYTLNAAREVGRSGKVIAVEPVPFNNAVLRRNVADNGFADVVETHDTPISDKVGQVTFNITEASDNGGFYEHPSTRVLESVTLTAATLDGLLSGRTGITAIKVDAEGHECEILEAGRGVIGRERPALFLEFNPKCLVRASHRPEDMLRVVSTLGYGLVFIDDRNGTFITSSRPHKHWSRFVDATSYINVLALPREKCRPFLKGCAAIFGVPVREV